MFLNSDALKHQVLETADQEQPRNPMDSNYNWVEEPEMY